MKLADALAPFEANVRRARELVSLQAHLSRILTSVVNTDDILRAALVLGVSAFDHFVHEVVRLGMLEIYAGTRKASSGFERFPLSMKKTQAALKSPTGQWLDEAIRETHGWHTFQQPEKVAEAIRLISDVKLWEAVAQKLSQDQASTKASLKMIVDRRNKIAHEADMDPTSPGQRWPIDEKLVSDALDVLEKTARAILQSC